jgi:hypothetical protein
VLPGFKAMSEEIKKPVEIAVREFDRDPNRISKNLFQELQVVEKIPIREVMDANSNPNTSRKSSRVSHSQLQTLAKRNELLDDKGALDNLAGSYAEAIALKEYRGDRIFGSAIYEPVSKGKKIIQEISKVTQGFIPKQVSQVFKGIPGVNYVPILDMDRESFSKLKLDNRRELVSMMKEAGGYVVVREGFAQRSR